MSDSPFWRCFVTKDYQSSNSDPIKIQEGEPFHVSEKTDLWDNNPAWIWVWCTDQRGKSAWVPKTIIQMDRDGKTGTTSHPYDVTELTVTVGDELTVEQEESGWLWCVNQESKCGWVPVAYVRW
ncbi:MAG: SH3 domain-containing protein [Ktedonobacteraceae bacterium]